jgi:hypothetical protein
MKNQEIEEKARELADMVGSVAVAEEERAIRLEYSTDTTKGGAAWRAAEQRSTQRYTET